MRAARDNDTLRCWCVSKIFSPPARSLLKVLRRLIQIDDPNLSFFCDEAFVSAQRAEGTDTEALLDLYVKSHNDVLKALPADLTIGVHLCRGNFPGGVHLGSGAYDSLAKKLFQDFAYEIFYLEYDSERAGSFSPLKYLPPDKAVVLGIVTTKFAEIEDLLTLKGRVYEAADIIANAQGRAKEDVLQRNLAVSPQCGFASASDGTGLGMTIERQWEKLELLKTLAEEIWPKA